MSDAEQPSIPSPDASGAEFDWDLWDRCMTGPQPLADPHDLEVLQQMLARTPGAADALQHFVQALEPERPSVEEQAALRQTLQAAMYGQVTAAAPRVSALRAPTMGTLRTSRARSRWMAAATVCALAIAAFMANRIWRPASSVTQQTHATARGERIIVHLPDGSAVVLGPESQLQYGMPFGDRDRTVSLQGEGYFTVMTAPDKPFVVTTAHSATQVLGTEFFVQARHADTIDRIVVTDGKVAFRAQASAAGSGTTLVQGDLAQMNRGGLMTVTRGIALDRYVAWKNGQLRFDRMPVAVVIHDIERWYDVTIDTSRVTLAGASVSLALDTESLDQAMALLGDVLGVSWQRTGRHVQLVPRAGS